MMPHDATRGLPARELLLRLDEALQQGRITPAEYQYFLQHEFGTSDRAAILDRNPPTPRTGPRQVNQQPANQQQATAPPAAHRANPVAIIFLAGVLLGLITMAFFARSPGITGYAVRELVPLDSTVFTESTNLTLNVTNLAGVRLSGSLTGSGRVILWRGDTHYLLWEGEPSHFIWTPWLDYSVNESVNLTIKNETNTSLWLTNKQTRTPFHNGQTIKKTGHYTIQALNPTTKQEINITIHNNTNFSRRPRSIQLRFTDECGEACTLNGTGNETITLSIELAPGSTLTLDSLTLLHASNHPPEEIQPFGALELAVGESVTLELDEHFTDPDGDALLYDVLHIPEAAMELSGSQLTITGVRPGTAATRIYASDDEELIESEEVPITVTAPSAPPQEHNTTNTTATDGGGNSTGAQNASTAEPATAPPATTPPTPAMHPGIENPAQLDCSNPDPNKRPLACLQEVPAAYFQPQELYLTTTGRKKVARFTPIGNMVITGDIIEHSTASPAKSDYQIGYEDVYGVFHPTIWVDSKTGDLHLMGELHEEQTNNVPRPGSFVLRNKRGIVVAWADQRHGDLFVRGMVVQRRRLE